MILSLQRALQYEEIRVASAKPQTISIGNHAEVLEYYQQAFLTFDPMLLPKILNSMWELDKTFQFLEQYYVGNMEKKQDRSQ